MQTSIWKNIDLKIKAIVCLFGSVEGRFILSGFNSSIRICPFLDILYIWSTHELFNTNAGRFDEMSIPINFAQSNLHQNAKWKYGRKTYKFRPKTLLQKQPHILLLLQKTIIETKIRISKTTQSTQEKRPSAHYKQILRHCLNWHSTHHFQTFT